MNKSVENLMNKYLVREEIVDVLEKYVDKEKYKIFLDIMKRAKDNEDITAQDYSDITNVYPLAFKFIGGNRKSEIYGCVTREGDKNNLYCIRIYNIVTNDSVTNIIVNYLNTVGNGLVSRNDKKYSTYNDIDAIDMLNSLENTKEMNVCYA